MSKIYQIGEQLEDMPLGTIFTYAGKGKSQVTEDNERDCLACNFYSASLEREDGNSGGCLFIHVELKPMCGMTERSDKIPVYYAKIE